MNHRPYPNVDRARRMVDRHKFEEPPAPVVGPHAVTEFRERLLAGFEATAAAAGASLAANLQRMVSAARTAQPGDYVLSTRRPGVVSGPR